MLDPALPAPALRSEVPAAPALAPGEALARFFEARGRRVFEALGIRWAEYRGPFHLALPLETCVDPDPRALSAALAARRVGAVRYSSATGRGGSSGLFVCDPRGYALARLDPRQRTKVQRGLARCELRTITPEELLAEGLGPNLETMARQRRFDPEFGEPGRWRRVVEATRVPGAWLAGAFVGGRLSAYTIAIRDGAFLHLLYRSARSAEMDHGTNPGLDSWILSQASRDPSLRGVTNGWRSITDGAEGLHAYKRHLGYVLEPRALAIRFHPALQPILASRGAAAMAAALSRARPADRRLQLAARLLSAARASR